MISPRCLRLLLLPVLLLIGLSLNAQTIDRTPSVEDRIRPQDSSAFVPLLEYVQESDDVTIGHSKLNTTPGSRIDSLLRTGTTGLNYCNDLAIHSGKLRITLDLGDDYNYDTTTFTVSVSLKIEGYDNGGGGVLITHDPVSLTINKNAPEQTFYVNYSGTNLSNHDLIDVYRIYVNSYSVSGGVNSAVRLTVRYDDEFAVNAIRPSPDQAQPIAVLLPFVSGNPVSYNPLTFQWMLDEGCNDRFPAWQLQVLRLYNRAADYQDDPTQVNAFVDWDEALTVEVPETDDWLKAATLTIPQGTGWYLWRVRPIGSLYAGESADARNWGVWTDAPATGTLIDYNGLSDPDIDTFAFYYEEFEDTLTWIYSRAFAEGEGGSGSRIAEGMTFLSPAGRAVQSQVREAEEGIYLTANSVPDFQGRRTFRSMAAPTGNSSEGFRFRRDLLNINSTDPYTAEDFDDDANWNNPSAIYETNGSASKYYNGTTVEEGSRIPDAENYPFARTLLSTDGSGRPKETGGIGSTYRIGGGAGGQDRTTKIYYAGAADQELIRLFGDEAPADTTVSKLLVTGSNKVTTVEWRAEGRLIATALQRSLGDTLLVGISDADEPELDTQVVDTLRSNRTRGERGMSSQKRYAFTDTTEISVHYALSPGSVNAAGLCVDTCLTCDYRVRLYVHNVELRDSTKVFEHNLGAMPCAEKNAVDTTITLTLPPGTYIIERRLEIGTIDPATIDSLHPYGRTYADQFRDVIAGMYRDSILADDSVAAIIAYLDAGELDSLYLYLGLDLDSLDTYDNVTVITTCCEITFPILDPRCGFDPCRDSVPDFEGYLFKIWGQTYDSSLNTYFKFDGDQDVWETTGMPAHPFNTLVANMLADTAVGGGPLYDCKELWSIWAGLVSAWEELKKDPDNPANFNPDFNMLDMFLQSAGTYRIDTSHTPYNTGNGYLLWAHRYVKGDVLNDSACKAWSGYNTGWHGDIDSTGKWQTIYNCWISKNRENLNSELENVGPDCDLSLSIPGWFFLTLAERRDSCLAYNARLMEDNCLARCEARRMEFALGIMKAYEEADDPISLTDALCKAGELVDTCRGDCELTVFFAGDSIGSSAQWEGVSRVYNDRLEIRKPDEDVFGTKFCLNDSLTLYEGFEIRYQDIIEQRLNLALDRYRAEYGGGLWIGFMDTLRGIAPDSITSLVTDSLVWIPEDIADSAYFEIRDSCELWFVADTIFHSGASHPLVVALNRFLDHYWGMEVDSSVAGVTDSWFNSGTVRLRQYDWETNAADLVSLFLMDSVRCVNGDLESKEIGDYIDFASQYERALFYNNERFGRMTGMFHMTIGGGASDEVIIQSAPNPLTDIFDVLHLAASDYSGSGTYWAYRAAGDTANPLLNQDMDKTYIIGDFDELSEFLDEPYTTRIGRFGIDSAGYLTYYDRKFDPAANPDTFRIFNIRFYGLPTRKLSDDACGLMRCPDICWRWVPAPDPDWVNVDTLSVPPCEETTLLQIRSAIEQSINECIDQDLYDLRKQYESSCGNPEGLDETITVEYPIDYFHFTLFYYDRAGRLVRTVPPKGVNVLGATATRMTPTSHTFVTEYDYNSLGQIIRTKSPDEGESRFWYDRVGRLRFSQDARLAALDEYAYTKFDDLGRTIEFGVSSDSISGDLFAEDSYIEDPDFPTNGSERTYMAYDSAAGITYLDGTRQLNLRNRVRKVWTDDTVVTHYSYDVHGNLVWIAQEIPGFPRKNYTKYEYDLISGNVNQVIYNEGRVDEFRHRYTYDADNAMTRVETSRDGVVWDTDAQYEYYRHGGLRRIELGEDKLQGLDLTYTVTGQLKAINHPSLDQTDDPGEDGDNTYGHQAFAADSFALMLHYHSNDFLTSGSTPFTSGGSDDLAPVPQYNGNIAGMETHVGKSAGGTHQYEERTGESYRYDHLGRLDSSRFHTYNTGTDQWNAFGPEYLTTYEFDPHGNIKLLERRGYDQSGQTKMDSITYHYQGGDSNKIDYVYDAVAGDPYTEDIGNAQSTGNYEYDEVGNLIQDNDEGGMTMEWDAYGKVKAVDRSIVIPTSGTQDIDYTYDAGGNRVRKRVETAFPFAGGETNETFYVHGAGGVVMAIYEKSCDNDEVTPPLPPGGPNDPDMDGWPNAQDNCDNTANPDQRDSDGDGVGDACDNCVCVANPSQQNNDGDSYGNACDPAPNNPMVPGGASTDPDGDGYPADHDNCPCIYNPGQQDSDGDGYGDSCDACDFHLVEFPIYGMGRLGVAMPDIDINNDLPPDTVFTRYLNQKFYELTDHLGNVRAVLGDRKRTSTPNAGNYSPEIRSYSHVYPFGMPQPGRTWDSSDYRYGYNGMETDPEVKEGAGQHYTTYFRQYDPRLGRWWSPDPVVHAGASPYEAMYDNPLSFADPLGNQAINRGGGSGTEPTGGTDWLTGIKTSLPEETSKEQHPAVKTIVAGLQTLGRIGQKSAQTARLYRSLESSRTQPGSVSAHKKVVITPSRQNVKANSGYCTGSTQNATTTPYAPPQVPTTAWPMERCHGPSAQQEYTEFYQGPIKFRTVPQSCMNYLPPGPSTRPSVFESFLIHTADQTVVGVQYAAYIGWLGPLWSFIVPVYHGDGRKATLPEKVIAGESVALMFAGGPILRSLFSVGGRLLSPFLSPLLSRFAGFLSRGGAEAVAAESGPAVSTGQNLIRGVITAESKPAVATGEQLLDDIAANGVSELAPSASNNSLLAFGTDDGILNQISLRTESDGLFDVVLHGTQDGLGFTVDGVFVTPQSLHASMLTHGYQQGMPVRLMSCFSGSLEDGAASQLSRLLGVEVVAPTHETWSMFGSWVVQPPGTFRIFQPSGGFNLLH